jgi:uncharacterized Zn finger protein (UPF0148 family)
MYDPERSKWSRDNFTGRCWVCGSPLPDGRTVCELSHRASGAPETFEYRLECGCQLTSADGKKQCSNCGWSEEDENNSA